MSRSTDDHAVMTALRLFVALAVVGVAVFGVAGTATAGPPDHAGGGDDTTTTGDDDGDFAYGDSSVDVPEPLGLWTIDETATGGHLVAER